MKMKAGTQKLVAGLLASTVFAGAAQAEGFSKTSYDGSLLASERVVPKLTINVGRAFSPTALEDISANLTNDGCAHEVIQGGAPYKRLKLTAGRFSYDYKDPVTAQSMANQLCDGYQPPTLAGR